MKRMRCSAQDAAPLQMRRSSMGAEEPIGRPAFPGEKTGTACRAPAWEGRGDRMLGLNGLGDATESR